MNRTGCWLVVICLLLGGLGRASAQVTDATRVAAFREERALIQKLEGEIPETRGTTWDYGGWYRFSFTRFDDFMKDRELADHDLRIWGTLSVEDIHQFYVRGRVTFVDWASGDAPNGRDHDTVGPDLELGWYLFRLSRCVKKYWHQDWPVDVDVKLGRQYIEIGRGVVLSQILDAASIDVGNFYFGLKLFGGRSLDSQENLDVTAPMWWHDKRDFVGVQASVKNVIPRHEPYVFWVLVDDKNSYNAIPPAGQRFGYNPQYYGFGSQGYIIRNLRYWAEYIVEEGKSQTLGTGIRANAVVAGAEYYFTGVPTRPRVELEFGRGSGDGDKLSPTDTFGGNTPGTSDHCFLAYGYHDTGVAFAPRLANLRVYRATAACHPLERWNCLRNFELGMSYYWFEKDKRAGGVSDWRANLQNHNLGQEFDVFANWRITSDLLWSVRWGHFCPGRAFTDTNDREYVLTSVTYSF